MYVYFEIEFFRFSEVTEIHFFFFFYYFKTTFFPLRLMNIFVFFFFHARLLHLEP